MKKKLYDLIASAPCSKKIKAEDIEALVNYLVKNGVAILPIQGHRVNIEFPAAACTGTMLLDGEEFPVYISNFQAIQTGCKDDSTLNGIKKTPSSIKRSFTLIEY